jgi:pyruvate-ferredoxin/flavodoxin oxidoreductase
METRFRMLELSQPDAARILFDQAQADVHTRRAFYEYLANRPADSGGH